MPPCPAARPLSELEHGWITRTDGRSGPQCDARAAEPRPLGRGKEKATNTYLTLERRDTSGDDDDGPPPAAAPHSGARPRRPAPPPCGVPAGVLRRRLAGSGEGSRRGGGWVVRRSRDAGLRDRGTTTTTQMRAARQGGARFIPCPAVTPGDRNRGARDRGARAGPGARSTSLAGE
jgi:hypothetical protein